MPGMAGRWAKEHLVGVNPMKRKAMWLAAASGVMVSVVALAQPEAEPPPLRGPRVNEEAERGQGRFSERAAGRQDQARPVSIAQMRRMVTALASEEAPEGVRLSEDQHAAIEEKIEAFETDMIEYLGEHQDEVVGHLRQAGMERAAGAIEEAGFTPRTLEVLAQQANRRERPATPEGDAPMMEDGQREALAALAEMWRESPAIAHQRELGAMLTPEQREWVGQRMRRDAGPQGAGPGGSGPGRPGQGEMGMTEGENPLAGIIKSRRLARLLRDMTEEEQERLAEALERRRGARNPDGQPGGVPGAAPGGEAGGGEAGGDGGEMQRDAAPPEQPRRRRARGG